MLVRQSAIYLIGRIAPALITFALIGFYTHVLAPEDYGVFAFVTATATLIFSLSATWICTSAIRLYNRDPDRTPLLWSIAFGFAAILIAVGAGTLIVCLLDGSIRDHRLLLLGFLLFAFTAWFEINADILTARLKAKEYVVHNLVRTGLGGVLGGVLAALGFGAEGILLGTVLGLLIPVVFMTRAHFSAVRLWPPHPERLKDMLKFGMPLSLSYAMGGIVFTTDRYVVTAFEGAAALGLYAVAFDLADRIIKSIVQPLGTAALPLVIERYEREGPEGARRQAGENLLLLMGIACPASFGIIAVTPELVHVMVAEEYRVMCVAIVPVIALGGLLSGIRGHYFDHAFHLGMKTGRHVFVVGAMIVLNLTLSILFVRQWGAPGAAYASLAAYAAGLVISVAMGRPVFALPLLPREAAKILAASLAMMCVTHLISMDGPLAGLAVKIMAGGLTYGLLVYLFDVAGLRQRVALHGLRGALRLAVNRS